MRKLFLAIMSVSAAAVLLGGIAFAWSTTASGSYSVGTGALSVSIYNPLPTGNLLYPTGNPIEVAYGNIQNNTPANPGIQVQAVAAGSNITGISAPACGVNDGGVTVTDNSWVNPGGNVGDVWHAYLTMPTWAPNSCQGGSISYTVNVNVNVQTP